MTQPTKLNYVTCAFGVKGDWIAGYHTGIDYRASVGTPIHATRGGRVIHAGEGGRYGSAYGKYVVLQSFYKGKPRQHLYAHLSEVHVKVGKWVRVGQVVGLSGETGNVRGAHLHYEERIEPFTYWSHTKPVFPDWKPKNQNWLKRILHRIGL